MAGALLRSGTLQAFRALGVDGQPVYGAAQQLREAVRLRLGSDAAQCLALPQPSENGERIDWYAPLEGDVVPWSAATEDERASAYAQLDALHARLRETAGSLSAAAGKGADENRDKQVFARLLDKSLNFPGSEHVYLVDGKPVVTFWGFIDRDGDDIDPLLCLRPPMAAPATAAAVAAAEPPLIPVLVEERRGRPWWWWLLWLLLLLLLLWLLLFALRACVPRASLPFGLGTLDLPMLPAPVLERVEGRDGDPPDVALGSGTGAAFGDGGAVDNGGGAGAGALPDGAADANAAGGDADGALPEAAADAGVPGIEDAAAAEADAGLPPPEPDGTAIPAGSAPAKPGGAPLPPQLAIPPEAAAAGSTDFLNGRWRAGAGIQDAQTGKPLRLDYTFTDGQGQVRVERGDGVLCSGQVGAAMQGGQLTLNSPEQARCDDGSSYRLPEVQCSPGAQATADCTGIYQNQRFPVLMRQAQP